MNVSPAIPRRTVCEPSASPRDRLGAIELDQVGRGDDPILQLRVQLRLDVLKPKGLQSGMSLGELAAFEGTIEHRMQVLDQIPLDRLLVDPTAARSFLQLIEPVIEPLL